MTLQEQVLEIWRGSECHVFGSREIGLLMLERGVVSVDACRAQGLNMQHRMPHATLEQVIQYGAQRRATQALASLCRKGWTQKDSGRPARYWLTDAGLRKLSERQHLTPRRTP